MESDLSLIEISGEDDSLLQQIPALDDTGRATTSTNYYFPCSPLQVPGSNRNAYRSRFPPPMGLKDEVDAEKPTRSSPIGSSNKENINVSRTEVPKLSVEPQQMKRRKRGGTYNLRKSLAWDRAFFTEEGVLNPLELSILSGGFGNSCGELLPTIHEEGMRLPSNSGSSGDSADSHAFTKNLSKTIPGTNSKDRDIGGSPSMKHVSPARHNAAPTSLGTPKMLSNQLGGRTGSKSGGCPRPLVFSSLKRPANASSTTVAMKEPKLPKIPVSRSGAHTLPKSDKSNVLNASSSKHNQSRQTDIVCKNAGLLDSSKTTKSSTNKAKAGSDSLSLTAKSSLHQPKRNTAKNVEVHSSTKAQPLRVTKANCGLEALPGAVPPPAGSRASNARSVSGKTAVLLPQNTWGTSGNTRYTQSQTTKPSGLRLPSPSLGFFGQPENSPSNSSSQRATHKFDQSSKEDSVFQMNINNGLLQSGSSNLPKKDINTALTIACTGSRDSNAKFASQTSCVGVKVIPRTNDAIKEQHVEEKQYSISVGADIFESKPECAVDDMKHGSVKMQMESSAGSHGLTGWNGKNEELLCASVGETDQVPSVESHNITCAERILFESRKSIESRKCKRENVACMNSHIWESNKSEKPSSHSPRHKREGQAKEGSSAGVDQLSEKLHVEDVRERSLDETLLVKGCDDKLRTSEAEDQYLKVDHYNKSSGEHPKLPTFCLISEEASMLNLGLVSDDHSLLSESIPGEESEGVHGLEAVFNVSPEKGDDSGSRLNCSNVLADMHDIEQPQVRMAPSSSSEIVPPVGNHIGFTDAQIRLGLSLKTIGDQTTDAVTTCNSMVFCSSSKAEDIGANGLEDNILAGKSTIAVSADNPHEDNARIEMNADILFGERRLFDKLLTEDLTNTADAHLVNECSPENELKKCQMASPIETAEKENEDAAGIDKTTELCIDEVKVQSLGGDLLVGNSKCELSNSAVAIENFSIVGNVIGQYGGEPELQTPNLVVDQNFQDNHGLHFIEFSLLGKSTSFEEPQEKKVLANVPLVQERRAVGGSELKSSSDEIQAPLSMQESDVDVESTAEHQLVEGAPSDSVDIESVTEQDKFASVTSLGNDVGFNAQATPSECDSVLMTMEDQVLGVVAIQNAFCLSKESGFSLNEIQTSADDTKIEDMEVDQINNICMDTEVNCSEKNVSPKPQHMLDHANCLTEEEDETIKSSGNGERRNDLMIKPSVNAVPFSDEWLAAIESVGEEILTMKSGAVQNSPPDKSLPEPGPWSPVKRKHSIGPFDCTKITNIPPPGSD